MIECIDDLVDHESEGGSDSTSELTQLASRGGLGFHVQSISCHGIGCSSEKACYNPYDGDNS